MSLRARLVLAAAYLLTVVVVALEIPLARNVADRAVSEFEASVLSNAAILSAQVSDLVATGGAATGSPPAELTAVVDAAASATGARVVVVDARGRLLADSDGQEPPGVQFATTARPEFAAPLQRGRIEIVQRRSETLDEDLLLVAVPVTDQGRAVGAVRVSESLADVQAGVLRSWAGLGAIGLAVVTTGLALAWFLAGTLVRPVRRLEETAALLEAGDLQARARPEGPRELATLGQAFNRMASSLAANVEAQRDFVANASHQLRTPLTGLRLRLESIQARGGTAGEEAGKAQAEVDRLAELIDDLLQLARAASVESSGSAVDLVGAAREAVDRWEGPASASDKHLRLHGEGTAAIWADPADVGHVLDNLLENAVRYTPAGTAITVEAGRRGGEAVVCVADDGPGVAPEDRDRLFERFYRGSAGRRAGPGSGLGLAIVAELVRRWGGSVGLADGTGTRVEIRFPAREAFTRS